MGQKTHPLGFRLGIVKQWKSRWYAEGNLADLIEQDEKIRNYLKARLGHAAISSVEIERKPGKIVVTINTGRPGVVIGKRGAEVDKLRDELTMLTGCMVTSFVAIEVRVLECLSKLHGFDLSPQMDAIIKKLHGKFN